MLRISSKKCRYAVLSLSQRVNRVPPPEDEWMRRDAEANAAAAFYYHQQQSADEYVLTDDEVLMQSCLKRLGCMAQPQRRVHSTFPRSS